MARAKTWVIVLLVIFGLFLLFTFSFIWALKSSLEATPTVKRNSVLKINLQGHITEKYPENAISKEIESSEMQMFDIYQALRMAKVDDRIRGIYLRISSPGLGWAKAEEIHDLLEKFKQSGKFVIAFLESSNELSYFTALPADEIYLQPHSVAEFNGFATEVPFFKRTLNKLGINPQVENIGKYKSAGDILKRDSMSPAHREATRAILEDVYEAFVTAVVKRKNLQRQNFEALLDKGIYQSEEAFEAGLVDGLKYENEVQDIIREKIYGAEIDKKVNFIPVQKYARINPKEVGLGRGEKIALVYAIGTIVSGKSEYSPMVGRVMGSQSVVNMLQKASKNRLIKAIIMRVDSPGGSAIASDEIWAEIEKIQKKKPVIVSMSDVAASGGYWISMGSDAIVAQPNTLTGSIGVVGSIFDLSGTYDKIELVWETVKIGSHADIFTDKRPMTPEEWRILKKMIKDTYDTFVQKVAEGRKMSRAEVDKIAQGRVWSGKRAFQLGLVDTLGGLDAAIEIAKQKAGIKKETEVELIAYPKKKSFFESLLSQFNVQVKKYLFHHQRHLALNSFLPDDIRQFIQNSFILRSLSTREILAMEPYIPIIK